MEFSALSGETYGVSFDGFLFMIVFSLSVLLSLIGIGTSVLIALLMRERSTRLMLYYKYLYCVEHTLVNAIFLSRADVLSDLFSAMPLSNTCREVFDNRQQLFDNLNVVCR